jgi:hypothetical protein
MGTSNILILWDTPKSPKGDFKNHLPKLSPPRGVGGIKYLEDN